MIIPYRAMRNSTVVNDLYIGVTGIFNCDGYIYSIRATEVPLFPAYLW